MADEFLHAVAARVSALSFHEWFNFAMCLAGMLVALSAANKMSRDTELTIIVAFSTVGAGLLGAALSYFTPERWQLAFDTLLYGGTVALLIGTRRRTAWIHPRWMPVVSALASILTWSVFFGTVK